MSSCKVCESTSKAHEVCTLLGRHSAPLYSCATCGFLYFDSPHWLAEAYSDAIVPADTGVVVRNTESAVMTTAILAALYPDAPRQRFLWSTCPTRSASSAWFSPKPATRAR